MKAMIAYPNNNCPCVPGVKSVRGIDNGSAVIYQACEKKLKVFTKTLQKSLLDKRHLNFEGKDLLEFRRLGFTE